MGEASTERLCYGAIAQPGTVFQQRSEGHQFGMYATCQGAVHALANYSRADALRFVCSPFALETVAKETEALGRAAKVKPTVETLVDFLHIGAGPTTAWLDIGGDASRPFKMRARVGGDYPVAVAQHSVSYGYAAHSWFLPLLLGDVRACDTVICSSTAAAKSIQATLDYLADGLRGEWGNAFSYHGRLDVIPHGVDVEHFRPIPRAQARKAAGLPEGDLIILWAGRISAQDKADLIPVLEVFRGLAASRPNLRLVFAGASRGNEAQVLAAEVTRLGLQRQVTALGLVPRALLPFVYSAADVFLSPADSMPETFGLTVVEAMACGVPVVASNWNGYKDTVQHGGTGFLVDVLVGDVALANALSDWSMPQGELLDVYAAAQATAVTMHGRGERSVQGALERLLGDPLLRSTMGEAARKRAADNYAWPRITARIDDLFLDLRGESRRSLLRDPHYLSTHLERAFCDYGTGTIKDGTRLTRVAGKKIPMTLRPSLGVVAPDALEVVYGRFPAAGSESVGAVADTLRVVQNPKFHIAWLVKHGFLEVIE